MRVTTDPHAEAQQVVPLRIAHTSESLEQVSAKNMAGLRLVAAASGEATASADQVEQDFQPIQHLKAIFTARRVVEQIHEALEELIDQCSRPMARMGFKATESDPVYTESLEKLCSKGIKQLNQVISHTATDQFMVAVQEAAKNIKVLTQHLRLFLRAPEYTNGVDESALGYLAQNCIAFQRQLADPLNDLASMAHGLVVQRGSAGEEGG